MEQKRESRALEELQDEGEGWKNRSCRVTAEKEKLGERKMTAARLDV